VRKERTEWVWRNDPEQRPDLDHSRCIAAPGERIVHYGPQLFKMTTVPCSYLSESDAAHSSLSFSKLRLEYTGIGWERGRQIGTWGSQPFDAGPFGEDARLAAGQALMSTVAGALDHPVGPKGPMGPGDVGGTMGAGRSIDPYSDYE
jgi:hypothetical protein